MEPQSGSLVGGTQITVIMDHTPRVEAPDDVQMTLQRFPLSAENVTVNINEDSVNPNPTLSDSNPSTESNPNPNPNPNHMLKEAA